MASRSAITSLQECENVKPTTPYFLVVPGVQATAHHTQAVRDQKQSRAVGDHEPQRKQNYLNSCNHYGRIDKEFVKFDRRLSSRRELSTASTSSSRASSSKTYFKQSMEKHNSVNHFPKDPNYEVCRTHERYESAMQKTSSRSGGQNYDCRRIW